jgi:hypothetical protein
LGIKIGDFLSPTFNIYDKIGSKFPPSSETTREFLKKGAQWADYTCGPKLAEPKHPMHG